MDISETIVVYDVKVGRCSHLNEYIDLYEYQRSRTFTDLVQGHSGSTFSNFFSWETAMPIEAKFHVEPQWDRGTKVYSNGLGHMTKTTAIPIHVYGKNMKNSSSLEPKGRWPWKSVCSIKCSSTTKFVQMMILGWPWPILRQGQIWSPMLLYGEKLKQWIFSRNYCSLWYKNWCMQSTKWVHEAFLVPKVKVIDWPWSKSRRFNIFKLLFLNNH